MFVSHPILVSLSKQLDYQLIMPNTYVLIIHNLMVGRDIIDQSLPSTHAPVG